MNFKVIACAITAVAFLATPAMAAKKKMKRGSQMEQSQSMPGGIVGGAVGTAGAIAGGAVATAGAIATAPFQPMMGPPMAVSTINGPTCKRGDWVTINGNKMRCQ